jgi:hypothetical protein
MGMANLYKDIHKGIRSTLFGLVEDAGRTDPGDVAARASLAGRVDDLARFLTFHAEHEDARIDPALSEVLADQATAISAEHVELDATILALVDRANAAADPNCADARSALHELYLDLAAFTSRYLAHQHVEERTVLPALLGAYGVEAIVGIHGAILASIQPADMAWGLAKMIPAMNVEDRVDLFVDMSHAAPPEAVAAMIDFVSTVLSADDHRQLVTRFEATRVPVGSAASAEG